LVSAHCRAQQQHASTKGEQRLDKQVLDYSAYKPALVFFALVNGMYNTVLKVIVSCLFLKPNQQYIISFLLQNVSVGEIESDWPGVVAEYIRHNDEAVLRAITDKLLSAYQNDFLTCGSFDEFCDVAGKINWLMTCT